MSFEQNWLALHQVLATRPTGDAGGGGGGGVGGAGDGGLKGAQSVYPFTRGYIYAKG